MEKIVSHRFYSGTSGLLLPIPKYQFPAPFENASRLTYYSTLYNSIEINSSFYKIPQPSTIGKWAESVPDDFKFTFKLWQGISHKSGFKFEKSDVERFMKAINQVGSKSGCLLIQLPPSMGNKYILQLEKLLKCIDEIDPNRWKTAVEFRNSSWYAQPTFRLLNSFGVALVIHDMPLSATPVINDTSDFMYVRFHGPTGNYDGGYSEAFLRDYATYAKDWMASGKEVYMYFNNTIGDALKNLESINSLVHSK